MAGPRPELGSADPSRNQFGPCGAHWGGGRLAPDAIMAAVIALHPETDRGRKILDDLEKRAEMRPAHVVDDGTRRYYLVAGDAGTQAFDPMLDKIDPAWRQHLSWM